MQTMEWRSSSHAATGRRSLRNNGKGALSAETNMFSLSVRLRKSHTRTRSSSPVETSCFPSAENATDAMASRGLAAF